MQLTFNQQSLIPGIVDATQEQEAIGIANAGFLAQATARFDHASALETAPQSVIT